MSGVAPTIVQFKISAGSGRNRFLGVMADGTIKVGIEAPPERGKANRELIAWLAKALDIDRGRIAIVAGEHAPRKRIAISGLSAAEIVRKLTNDHQAG